jgi:hypothetical protein
LRAEVDMPDDLQTYWDMLTPQSQGLIQAVGLVLLGLAGGHFLGSMVARGLRARNFDAALRPPGSPPPSPLDPDTGITPTFVAGWLVRLTVWAWPVWWLAREYGRADFANSLGLIVSRAWALAAVLTAGLSLGSILAHRLIDCLNSVPKIGLGAAPANGAAGSRFNLAGAVGAGAYFLVALLVLLVAADLFEWPLTRSSALALWQFAQHFLVAGAALLIGCLGARWARDTVTPDGAASQEKRAGQYTALGIIAASTILAVAVLLSSAGVLIGLAALGILGLLLWLVRGYLPDVAAGLQLRIHKVREVYFEEVAWQVSEVGLLWTQLTRAGEFCRLQNRAVLEARMHAAPVQEAAPR